MRNQREHDPSRKHAPLYRKHAQLKPDHIYAIDEADVGVLLRVVICGLVLVVSCVVWCCSCCVFVCVTCFSSYEADVASTQTLQHNSVHL